MYKLVPMLRICILLLMLLLCCPLHLLSMQQPPEVCKANELADISSLEDSSPHTLVLSDACTSEDVNISGRRPQQVIARGSEGIYVSVKTTEKYHRSRLQLLLLTWLQTLTPHQVNIVTELGTDDAVLDMAEDLGFNVMRAGCEASHRRQSLCCKSGAEYEHFYRAKELGQEFSWFCHFDDDVYLNAPVLVEILEQFSPSERIYIGKISISKTKKLQLRDTQLSKLPDYKQTPYSFATGAAYCLSSSLMTEVEHYLRGPLFEGYCQKLQLPDDMLVGAIVEAVLGYKLINDQRFNSHLHPLRNIKHNDLQKQATVSFGEFHFKDSPEPVRNVVSVPNAAFDEVTDPTRFLSVHCHLYPRSPWC